MTYLSTAPAKTMPWNTKVEKYSRWSERLLMYTDNEPTTHFTNETRERTACGLQVVALDGNGRRDRGWRHAGPRDWVSCQRCTRVVGRDF